MREKIWEDLNIKKEVVEQIQSLAKGWYESRDNEKKQLAYKKLQKAWDICSWDIEKEDFDEIVLSMKCYQA